ncbi:hypothetical protein FE257_001660 [Aspergillus nanangensis]|uniref:Rhodopsin domain-containing protein n=1 Tax=Aspergillus nanangensis TaxID=2582783 RepID=A0AAD4CU21_ASPNN|nr:hypothetical protein FE257_001660 [Aspergillus nanangensis]
MTATCAGIFSEPTLSGGRHHQAGNVDDLLAHGNLRYPQTHNPRYTVDEEENRHESAYWSRTLIAVAIASVVAVTLSFVLRLYSRLKTNWKPALEDVFMAIGLVFSYLLSACVIIAACNGAFAISMGSLALAEDVALLIIPITIVWRMKLARPEKIRITILFALGGLVCIFGILRVVELIHYQTDNLTASGAFEVTWAVLEINLGIVCACLVLMRPLLRIWKDFIQRHLRRDSTSSTRKIFSIKKYTPESLSSTVEDSG